MAHLRQSRPDYGFNVQVKALNFSPLRSEADLATSLGDRGCAQRTPLGNKTAERSAFNPKPSAQCPEPQPLNLELGLVLGPGV